MEDERTLLRAICEDPEGDAPRRAYVERSSDAIRRAYVELALAGREAESVTFAEHVTSWAAPLIGEKFVFHRGFVEELTIDAAAWLAHGESIVAAHPILVLHLKNAAGVIEQIAASRSLDRVVALNLFGSAIGPSGARALAESEHLSRLVWLDLGYAKITEPGLFALAASKSLPRLLWVNLVSNGFDDPCDEPWEDQGAIIGWGGRGGELEKQFGPLRWLHWQESVRPGPYEVLRAAQQAKG